MTRDLVKFCHGLQYSDLPQDRIRKIKCLLFDFIGVGIAASRYDSSKVIIDFVRGTKGKGTITGTAVGTSASFATLANCPNFGEG